MAVNFLHFDCPLGNPERPGAARSFERKLKIAQSWSLPWTQCGVRHDPAPPAHIPRTLREEPAPYATRLLPRHEGDGAQGQPPTPHRRRSWAACPFCGGAGSVAFSEPDPATGELHHGEEPCEGCDGVGWPGLLYEPDTPYDALPRFPLGRVLATPGALALAGEHCLDLAALLSRHLRGDWGEVGPGDAAANECALRTGARLLSTYGTPAGILWVVTEADRSATTVLLPDDY